MKLLAGLGNPGIEYANTLHNVGFRAVDTLCSALGGTWKKESKFKAEVARVQLGTEAAILVKPQTYMNLSGESIQALLSFYKIPIQNVIILVDEVNLAPGRIRIRPSGSPGGHNGLRSICNCLSSQAFARVRIGVGMGHHPVADLAAHVLSKISSEDEASIESGIRLAAEAALCVAQKGADFAMNAYNGPEKVQTASAQAAKPVTP